jgi:hypothetical protein
MPSARTADGTEKMLSNSAKLVRWLAVLLVQFALVFAAALAPACGETETRPDPEIAAVDAVFRRFQDAVLERDRDAFFGLVTPEILEVADKIDLEGMAAGRSAPLDVQGITAAGPARWHVSVLDHDAAAADPEPATFVVVRHGGRLLVDLVETAAATGGIERHGRQLDEASLELEEQKDLPGVAIPAGYRPSEDRPASPIPR